MALKIVSVGIIADDLTGANDTALQFLLRGCNTQIILNKDKLPDGCHNTVAWAINTESRATNSEQAVQNVLKAADVLYNKIGVDFIYKKIDSTLRGNIAKESLALLETQNLDAALIVPAFPDEGRTTVGGYQLLNGMPIERTEVARDPHCPISQSHIPTLLKQDCEDKDIVGHIGLNKVMKGAGPVLIELQKLLKEGKKLIVIDAVSVIDLDQIVLAMEKCLSNNKLLPCGSAGLAKALTKAWLPDGKYQNIIKTVPEGPILIVIGSITKTTRSQINLLRDYQEQFNLEFFDFTPLEVINGVDPAIEEEKINLLKSGKNLVVYTAPNDDSFQKTLLLANEKEINKEEISHKIVNRLADFTKKVVEASPVKFVFVGGETSSHCCKAAGSNHLQLIDQVDFAIPLCMDQKAQFIITKSGNLGTPKTLVNILTYLKDLEENK